jgi:hypothetical protein
MRAKGSCASVPCRTATRSSRRAGRRGQRECVLSLNVGMSCVRRRMSTLLRVAVLCRITGPSVASRSVVAPRAPVPCSICCSNGTALNMLVLCRGHQFAQMIHHPDPGETNYIVDISRCAPRAAALAPQPAAVCVHVRIALS